MGEQDGVVAVVPRAADEVVGEVGHDAAGSVGSAAAADGGMGLAATMAEVLGALLDREPVGHHDHFFDVLGANSMTMAHFCAKLRKQPGFPPLSMKQVYAQPTISGLAESLAPAADQGALPETLVAEPEPPPLQASTAAYVACGAAQGAIFLIYSYVLFVIAAPAYAWIGEANGLLQIYLRSIVVGGGVFLGVCLLPILAKWVLIGRWTEREIPLWSLAYLRFWVVKSLLHANPIILFVGHPVYPLYLRALGARIGPGVLILTRSLPVCTDLLTIGAGAVVRKDSFLLGYRAQAGVIQTGPVSIGAGAFVGEKTVLDIDTVVGEGSQLGHTSSLQAGERVPDGEHWHGAPAERTEVDYVRVAVAEEPVGRARWRRAGYVTGSLLQLFGLVLPLAFGGSVLLVWVLPSLGVLESPTLQVSAPVYLRALALAAGLFVVFGVLLVLLVFVVPRIAGRLVRPDTVYPLYGVHYSLHRTITTLTNRRLLTWLFGDSSYITGYLSRLGYDLGTVEQTGSNFGTEVKHETPYQVVVGGGTMVADGLSLLNANYSSRSFAVSPVRLGSHSFLGNHIAYPSGGRIGENCLLATKVMVPLDGPVREGIGLLGSPPFEIPRTVERDARFDHFRAGEAFETALRGKNRYNLRSMLLMSGLRFVHLFLLTLLALAVLDHGVRSALDHLLVAVYGPAALALTAMFWIVVERTLCRFRALQPQLCSIYDPYFWWHERLWKVPDVYLKAFSGTPFKSVVWRLLGVRIGARVYDDGVYLTERSMVTLGDDVALNVGSVVQCHSQEDGTFKSDRIVVGSGATVGVGGLVHYGATVGEGATVLADSFVMKGEEIPARSRWGGNPAAQSTRGVRT